MAERENSPRDGDEAATAHADRDPWSPPDPANGGRDGLVQEGLDHLQRAARETIAAMRALLDVAEEIVEDPKAAETLITTIGSLAEGALRAAPRGMFGRASPGPEEEDDEGGGGVQRIPVS